VVVLVSVSSKHGGSEEIANVIAEELRQSGLGATVLEPNTDPPLGAFDAYVVGSALYMGRWMGDARKFVEENSATFRHHPTWLFSSGPISENADPRDSAEGDRLARLTDAREHVLFGGRLQKEGLGLGERTIVRMVHSPWGDFRPWDEIRAWAREIATELNAVPA
jgi:menaquinone-dependent protoporphyrinogen oxidase